VNKLGRTNFSNNAYVIACIPAYNESKTISNLVQQTKKYVTEVIVYDDGSVDNTCELARTAGATVIRSSINKGYGVAIKSLFQAAKQKNADVMITLDSDGQHDPDQIPDVLEPILEDQCDISIGSRFLNPIDKQKVPMYRSFGIRTITKLTSTGSLRNITDAQSGFRAFNKRAFWNMNLFEEGMAVSTEILLLAKEKNLVIKEVPATIRYDVSNPSTHNPIAQGINTVNSIVQFISLRHPLAFYVLPGLILLGVAALFTYSAVDLYSATKYISTNTILVSLGTSIIGMVLLATGIILNALIALLRRGGSDYKAL
jgi:glycosyltransferase involved in cell wall biosynthesis